MLPFHCPLHFHCPYTAIHYLSVVYHSPFTVRTLPVHCPFAAIYILYIAGSLALSLSQSFSLSVSAVPGLRA